MGSLYISSTYSSGSALHKREESEVRSMQCLCHVWMSWDCTRGYDFFVGVGAAFDIRVTANLKKENFSCIVLVKRPPNHRVHAQYLKFLK